MPNVRGNTYSKNHTTLDPEEDPEFWNFSWHEMGIYDLPNCIDYILEETNETSVYYVAHTQGATALYVMLSELPQYNEKITVYAHLSPIAYIGNLKSPLFKLIALAVKLIGVSIT